MSTNNNIRIIGNMGRDPEMTYAGEDGSLEVTKFSVAVNRRKNSGTDWFNCVAFRGTAKFVNDYGAKGRKGAIVGEMRQSKWQTEDGQTRTSWELVVDGIEFLDRRDATEDDINEPDDL